MTVPEDEPEDDPSERPLTPDEKEEARRAGYFDISEWGDKDFKAAYKPGATLDLGDGDVVEIADVPDYFRGEKRRSDADEVNEAGEADDPEG